jgi:hypothetical protein
MCQRADAPVAPPVVAMDSLCAVRGGGDRARCNGLFGKTVLCRGAPGIGYLDGRLKWSRLRRTAVP